MLADLMAIYAERPETARPRARLKDTENDIIDGADLVRLAERELMARSTARRASPWRGRRGGCRSSRRSRRGR